MATEGRGFAEKRRVEQESGTAAPLSGRSSVQQGLTCTGMLSRMIKGRASAEGTERFRDRFSTLRDAGHFRRPSHVPGAAELWFSSIGIGTYLGDADQATDQLYRQAIEAAFYSGINVVDAAINYRHQRSERSIGKAIQEAIAREEVQRDEIIVCSKAGYLSFDGEVPQDPMEYFNSEYVKAGIFKREEVAGMQCMAPGFLENQLERSRKNLGLETIDIYYLHNPEAQLAEVDEEHFNQRLKHAFATLEKAVSSGKIQFYGIASWNAFRVPEGSQPYMSLQKCAEIAREVGGAHHHFRFVQLPFNLAMPEAFAAAVQPCTIERCGKEMTSLLESAEHHRIAVIGSSSLSQSRLTRDLPESLATKIGLKSDLERALQFARSAPGILTALVGMGRPAHVIENTRVASERPMQAADWKTLF
jgi:aryl-alcohol dehydrogenase-like predicted oxidoreductase